MLINIPSYLHLMSELLACVSCKRAPSACCLPPSQSGLFVYPVCICVLKLEGYGLKKKKKKSVFECVGGANLHSQVVITSQDVPHFAPRLCMFHVTANIDKKQYFISMVAKRR